MHDGNLFWSAVSQNFMQLIPIPTMLYIKYDQDRPVGLENICVWKCGWTKQDQAYYSKTCLKTASLKRTKNWYSRPFIA